MKESHSNDYIKQLLDWGFSKEFIARDANISLESLEMRLYRARKREQNVNQGNEHQASGDLADSG